MQIVKFSINDLELRSTENSTNTEPWIGGGRLYTETFLDFIAPFLCFLFYH